MGDDMYGGCVDPVESRSSAMVNFFAITPRVVESARFRPTSTFKFFLVRFDLADLAGLASIGVNVAMPAVCCPDRRVAVEPGCFELIMGDETDVRGVVWCVVFDCHDLVRVVDCRLADLRLLSTEA